MDVRVCDVCGKHYRCPTAFKRHVNKHKGVVEPKVPCDICGRLLVGKLALRSHKLINHPKGGILPYVCRICSKPLATRSLLTRHITLFHKPLEHNQQCAVCDKKFKNLLDLKVSRKGISMRLRIENMCRYT